MTDCERRWTLSLVNLYVNYYGRCTEERERQTYRSPSSMEGGQAVAHNFLLQSIYHVTTAQITFCLG